MDVARMWIAGALLVATGCSVPCVDDGLLSMQHDRSCGIVATATTTGMMSTTTGGPTTSTTTMMSTGGTTEATTTDETASDGSSGGDEACVNKMVDGDESDIDCGGDDCMACQPGFECDGDPDNCVSGACNSGVLCIDPQLCTLPAGVDLLASPKDQLGVVVDVIGDVSGDGIDDIVAASAGPQPRGFVIYGDPTLLVPEFDLAAIESGQGGFAIYSSPIGAVAPAGDFNDDGVDDFAVADPVNERVYVVFGRDDAAPVSPIDVLDGNIDGQGVQFSAQGLGRALAGGLDVDGDGRRDFVMSGPNDSFDQVYVVFDQPGLTNHPAGDVGATVAGFQITASFIGAGHKLALLPDLNGDGLAEIVVAAPYFANTLGRVYVVFGKSDFAKVDLDESSPGYYSIGAEVPQELLFGEWLAAAGDVDGDGLHDIIASTVKAEAYVIFGRGEDADIDIDALGAGGFKIVISGGDSGFLSVGGGRDVNGDGLADLLLGTPYTVPGTLWVVFGKGTPGDVQTADVEAGVGGFAIRLPDANADFAASFGVGDPLGLGVATAAIGAPRFMNDEGLIRLVILGLCP